MKLERILTVLALVAVTACGSSQEDGNSPKPSTAETTPSQESASENPSSNLSDSQEGPSAHPLDAFYLETPPSGAVEVAALRSLESGSTVTVRGDIQDFAPVGGKAVLSLYDHALLSCDEKPGDQCQTPWDFCCVPDAEIAKASAMVEFRQEGRLVSANLDGFHGMTYLSDVIVVGTLQLDEAGNARITATGIHVE